MLPVSQNPPSLWPEDVYIEDIQGEWKIVHLKPRQEKALARDLIEIGISYCCPFYTNIVRRKDNNKPRKSVLPVFPGYLAFSDTGDCVSSVLRTNRVMRVLPVMDQSRLLEELKWILTACKQGKAIRTLTNSEFQKGQNVRIISGPMRGFEGTITNIGGKKHVILSVEMFRQSIAVQIEQSQISTPSR